MYGRCEYCKRDIPEGKGYKVQRSEFKGRSREVQALQSALGVPSRENYEFCSQQCMIEFKKQLEAQKAAKKAGASAASSSAGSSSGGGSILVFLLLLIPKGIFYLFKGLFLFYKWFFILTWRYLKLWPKFVKRLFSKTSTIKQKIGAGIFVGLHLAYFIFVAIVIIFDL